MNLQIPPPSLPQCKPEPYIGARGYPLLTPELMQLLSPRPRNRWQTMSSHVFHWHRVELEIFSYL
jgi:hypothetical protein